MKLRSRFTFLATATLCSLLLSFTPTQAPAAPSVVTDSGSSVQLGRVIGQLNFQKKAKGTVKMNGKGASDGEAVKNGALIQTKEYSVRVNLSRGGYVEIAANSKVRIYDDEDQPVRLDIAEGGGKVFFLHNLPQNQANTNPNYAEVIREDNESANAGYTPISFLGAGIGTPVASIGGGGGSSGATTTKVFGGRVALVDAIGNFIRFL